MIIVDATSIRNSGALSILYDFLKIADRTDHDYLILLNEYLEIQGDFKQIKFKRVENKKLFGRLFWDSIGFNKCINSLKINPGLIITLQNTSLRHSFDCCTLIYLHQAIPFSKFYKEYLYPQNLKLLFYRIVYKKLIFQYFNKKSIFVVQSNTMKSNLLKNNIDNDSIFISRPKLEIDKTISSNVRLDFDCNNLFFYPSTNFFYKNHELLVYVSKELKKDSIDHKFIFTCTENELKHVKKLIDRFELNNHFVFLGTLSRSEVFYLYDKTDLIVFPSKIETIGLPLIEAAKFNKKILVSDLSYSREILSNYPNARFANPTDYIEWVDCLKNLIKSDLMIFEDFQNHEDDVFYDLINTKYVQK